MNFAKLNIELINELAKKNNEFNKQRDRINKAFEVNNSLAKFNIDSELCGNLKEFKEIMNDWVKDGIHRDGKIKLPEINKKLVYRLYEPSQTIVKLEHM